MKNWTLIPDDTVIAKTAASLKSHGINTIIVADKEQATAKIVEILPKGAEVMTMTSMTLEALGIPPIINDSGHYNSVRNQLNKMDRATQGLAMKKLGAAPEWTLGSVHALTEDGKVLVASNTGSQLSAYAYASPHIIWVVGAQKIVKDLSEAFRRIEEYVLHLESNRVQKAYGMPHSAIRKTLVFNSEGTPNRITIIIVKEALGF